MHVMVPTVVVVEEHSGLYCEALKERNEKGVQLQMRREKGGGDENVECGEGEKVATQQNKTGQPRSTPTHVRPGMRCA